MAGKVRSKLLLWGLASCLTLVFATSAYAASPGTAAYSGIGAAQVSQTMQVSSTTTPTTSTASASSLPFTGMDIGLVAAVGVSLVGIGFVIRRSVRADRN